jgi:hypothetical protein
LARPVDVRELGIAIPLDERPLHECRDDLGLLVEAGYDGVWTGELNAVEGLLPLGLCAGWQPGVALSCAVANVYTRAPAVLAMAAATLAELTTAPVRFGIGAGSAVIAETWNGVPFEAPFGSPARPARGPRSRSPARSSDWLASPFGRRPWCSACSGHGCNGWPPLKRTAWW